MRTRRELKAMFPDPKMRELIDSLWREIHDDNVIEEITQELHGFVFGQTLKLDVDSLLWIKTKADSLQNAGTEGIVCRIVDENTFDLRIGGVLKINRLNPYLPGVEYYLSPDDAGAVTSQADQPIWPDGSVQEFIGRGIEEGLLLSIDRSNHADKYYRHTQSAPSRVWEVVHNLDKFPSVTISDFDGNEYESDIKQIDRNNTLLTFSEAFAGYADLN
jgi:hypothetical protein